MSKFDILLTIILVIAAYRGYKRGIILQIGMILAIVLGAYIALKFSALVSGWLNWGEIPAQFIGILLFIAVFILILVLFRLLSEMLHKGILTAPLGLLGSALSSLKAMLIMALILVTFENFNSTLFHFRDTTWISESVFYKPLKFTAKTAFPFIKSAYTKFKQQ